MCQWNHVITTIEISELMVIPCIVDKRLENLHSVRQRLEHMDGVEHTTVCSTRLLHWLKSMVFKWDITLKDHSWPI